ncbi:unnamed protein product [Ostreobium quekettii]|uniref:LrgB-like protein n=1 Tax=Ostreobium quekettii TaxID=121088 RepID=A0A8S1JGW3_9CHLO|nr:unnamed protein product [Ostreobium quekettii]
MLAIVALGFVANLWLTARLTVWACGTAPAEEDTQDGKMQLNQVAFGRVHWAFWGTVLSLCLLLAVTDQLNGRQLEPLFHLSATVCGYLVGDMLPQRLGRILHPVVVCAALTSLSAGAFGVLIGKGWAGGVNAYLTQEVNSRGAGDWLMSFLGPVVLSFGFSVFSRRLVMLRHRRVIAMAIVTCSLFSMISTALAGRLLALHPKFVLAIVPRSVTVALALPIAQSLGVSSLPITAGAVVLTGLMGANFSAMLLTWMGITSPIARGLSAASSAHGLATAALTASESETLPYCSLAYALSAITSTLLANVPIIRHLLVSIAG